MVFHLYLLTQIERIITCRQNVFPDLDKIKENCDDYLKDATPINVGLLFSITSECPL